MRIPIHNVGKVGVIKDVSDYLLPPEAWTDALNIRFVDGSVYTSLGYEAAYINDGILPNPPIGNPTWFLPMSSSPNVLWAYPVTFDGVDVPRIYATNGVAHADITRAAGVYNGQITDLWNGTTLGGIGFLNNGVDRPQVWNVPGLPQLLTNLANWTIMYDSAVTGTAWTTSVLRAWKSHLFAFNTTENSIQYPQRMRWSHPIDPYTEPGVNGWRHDDPTSNAGKWDFMESPGPLIDGMSLGDQYFIYKSDRVYRAEFIGGRFIWKFREVFNSFGLAAQRCVKPTADGSKHVVFTRSDLIVHDGVQYQSLLNDRYRRWLLGRISNNDFYRTFIVPHYEEDEFWLCYTTVDNEGNEPNEAIIVNIIDGTITDMPLPGVSHGGWDFITGAINDDTFDAQDIAFDSMIGSFLQSLNTVDRQRLIWTIATPGVDASGFYIQDAKVLRNETSFSSYVERTGIALIGQDRQGNPKVDPTVVKHLTEVWVKGRVAGGDFMNVYVGAQQHVNGTFEWQGPFPFYNGQEDSIQPNIEGRLLAIRFEAPAGTRMVLESYDMDINPVGEW